MSTAKKKKSDRDSLYDSLYELTLRQMKLEPNPIDCCWIAQVFRKYPVRKDPENQRRVLAAIDDALALRLEAVVTWRFLGARVRDGCSDERLISLLEVIPKVSPSQKACQAFARVCELVIQSIGEIRVRGYYLLDSCIKDPLAVSF